MARQPVSTVNRSDLAALVKQTGEQVERLQQKIAELQTELSAAEERGELARRLLALMPPGGAEPTPQAAGDFPGKKNVRKVQKAGVGNSLEDVVEVLLRERGEPMHISDIRAALLERGVNLPGRGDEANVIVRLRRDPEKFVRPARGKYALREWGLQDLPTRRRARRSSKGAK